MDEANHQVVRLSAGAHRTPADGVCVMELVSMLAGEPFSDRPQTCCPVIAAFLRSYNDAVDDAARQQLYAYASSAVGSRTGLRRRLARARRCRRWARERGGEAPHWLTGGSGPIGAAAAAAATAGPVIREADALALLDELLGLDRSGADVQDALDVAAH